MAFTVRCLEGDYTEEFDDLGEARVERSEHVRFTTDEFERVPGHDVVIEDDSGTVVEGV